MVDIASSSNAESPSIEAATPNYLQLAEEYRRLAVLYRRASNALATSAHDLKTPLAIISGYVDLLQRQEQKLGPLTDRQRAVLDEIRMSVARLGDIVQDFLIFSSFQNGQLRMRFAQGDIGACVSEICNFWLRRFQSLQVALYTVTSPSLPQFPFDYHRVQRVISNLLENALRYAGTGGSVWVNCDPIFWERRVKSGRPPGSERRQRAVVPPAPNFVRISVSDTGPGVAPEYQLEIFDEFFKVDPGSEGVGLGLAIARRLIEAHGGRIWIENRTGGGATFSFTLPLDPRSGSLSETGVHP